MWGSSTATNRGPLGNVLPSAAMRNSPFCMAKTLRVHGYSMREENRNQVETYIYIYTYKSCTVS